MNTLDEFFRDSLESFNETPQVKVWDQVKAQLDADDAVKYKRKFIVVKKIAMTPCVILFLLGIYQLGVITFGNSGRTQSNNASIESNPNPAEMHFGKTPDPNISKIELQNLGRLSPAFKAVVESKIKLSKDTENNMIENIETQYSHIVFDFKSFNQSPVFSEIKPARIDPPGISKLNTELLIIPDSNVDRSAKNSPADNTIQINTFKPSFSLTAFASPVWAGYNLQDNLSDNINTQSTIQNSLQANMQQDSKSKIEQRETPELSFNAGVTGNYRFGRHWGVQSGLIFNSSYVAITPQRIYATGDANGDIAYKIVTSSGYGFVKPGFSNSPAIGDSVLTTTVQHNLQYISIPVLATYHIALKKFEILSGLGVSASILTSSSIQTELEKGRNSETVFISRLQGTKGIFLSLIASTEIKYPVTNKWSLALIPTFSYAITPVTQNSVVRTYPYNVSVGIGMNYKF